MEKLHKILLIFSTSGLLFAGYLSFYKLINKECALGETCPYFLGFPACYFGFLMYLALTVFSLALVLKTFNTKLSQKIIFAVSFLGILFAGYYTIGELPLLLEKGFKAYVLGLPTCALGLMFYVAIFLVSLYLIPRKK